MTDFVYALRTCNEDLSSTHGFHWPKNGPVACNDWKPVAECGNGLHGLLWGVGDGTYLALNNPDAKWLVVKVRADEVVDIQNKIKFPRGEVVYCGKRDTALARITKLAPKNALVIYRKWPRRFKDVVIDDVKAVRDSITGLTWDAEGSKHGMSAVDAPRYCANLGPGWRMPTEPELRTIVDLGAEGDHKIYAPFTCHGWWYRSSTPYTPGPGYSWGVDFYLGGSHDLYPGYHLCVRAVRASQS